jgi:predicted transcriptional regulator
MKETITVRLDPEIKARLDQFLARTSTSLSAFVRAAVVEQLDKPQMRKGTRSASLASTLATMTDTGQSDLSTTYKSQIEGHLRAKHSRR